MTVTRRTKVAPTEEEEEEGASSKNWTRAIHEPALCNNVLDVNTFLSLINLTDVISKNEYLSSEGYATCWVLLSIEAYIYLTLDTFTQTCFGVPPLLSTVLAKTASVLSESVLGAMYS